MSNPLPAWVLFALGSAVFAAATALLAKLGVASLSADLATTVRAAVILATAVAIVSARGEWRPPSQLAVAAIALLVLSGLATGLSWLCYMRALELGPVAGVVAIDKLSLVLVVGASAVCLGEPITWRVGLGAVLVTIGALLVSLPASPPGR